MGHGLQPCTSEVKSFKLSDPELADRDVVFVDTPGFDGFDADVFQMVSDWRDAVYVSQTSIG